MVSVCLLTNINLTRRQGFAKKVFIECSLKRIRLKNE